MSENPSYLKNLKKEFVVQSVINRPTDAMRYETVAAMINSGRSEELLAAHTRLYEILKNRDLSNIREIVKGSYFGEVLGQKESTV